MANLHVQISLPYTTGLPADLSTNNLYFSTVAAPTGAQLVAIENAIVGFFNNTITTTLAQFISSLVSRTGNACSAKVYDLADPTPRVPIDEWTFTLGAAGGTGVLPEEVAMCLSFRAAYVSGQPPARRRGRIYIGPLQRGASDTAGDRPIASFMTRLLDGAQFLYDTTQADAVNWVVWSDMDQVARLVVSSWVDNAFDTQRRRGLGPTFRQTNPLP